MDEDSSINAPFATLQEHKSPAPPTPSLDDPASPLASAWASIDTDVSLD